MTGLPSLAHLAHTSQPGGDPDATWAEYRAVIEDAISNDPRTLQERIGPSGLGDPCNRCLAHQLAQIPEKRDDAWLPTVGKAVHAWLEEVFVAFNAQLPAGQVRFLVETEVSVGEVDGVDITGHGDVYDLATAEVTDWKIVGVTTLRKVRKEGPSLTYRRQQHLYGRGFTRRGLPVERVRVAYLPRNEKTLDQAVIWSEPYDEQIAVDALQRADALAKAIRLAGPDAILPGLPVTQGCYGCARYPLPGGQLPPAPGYRPGNDLRGLIAPTAPGATAYGSHVA